MAALPSKIAIKMVQAASDGDGGGGGAGVGDGGGDGDGGGAAAASVVGASVSRTKVLKTVAQQVGDEG